MIASPVTLRFLAFPAIFLRENFSPRCMDTFDWPCLTSLAALVSALKQTKWGEERSAVVMQGLSCNVLTNEFLPYSTSQPSTPTVSPVIVYLCNISGVAASFSSPSHPSFYGISSLIAGWGETSSSCRSVEEAGGSQQRGAPLSGPWSEVCCTGESR